MKQKRPPIVTVLGHVDHGKTTLLDALRSSRIADREAGGITQSVGATQVETKEGKITFLDTPGHAAFSGMRERGAKIADIAILVVAADDGVMPQTKEAIDYIKKAGIPMIVAITKIDVKNANIEAALGSLEKEEVLFEGRGGDTPHIQVSAPQKKGLEELMEMVQLVADVTEIKADPGGPVEATVIETNKDKRGPVVSVVVTNGTLRTGMDITDGKTAGKVRGMFDEEGKGVKEAGLSVPVAVLGFSDLPPVGALLTEGSENEESAEVRDRTIADIGDEEVGVFVKTVAAGALEALLTALPKGVVVVGSSVGDVVESDVFFAKSTGVEIVTFESKAPTGVQKLADTEDVSIKSFKVIYELITYLEDKVAAKTRKVTGKADIITDFPFDGKRVAGSKIAEGRITKNDKPVLMRGDKELGAVKILSIRRGKDEVDVAKTGEECGILFVPQLDFQAGDAILTHSKTSNE